MKPFAKRTDGEGRSPFGDPHATTEAAVEDTAPKLGFEQRLAPRPLFPAARQ